jgi:hypothetical protein
VPTIEKSALRVKPGLQVTVLLPKSAADFMEQSRKRKAGSGEGALCFYHGKRRAFGPIPYFSYWKLDQTSESRGLVPILEIALFVS